MARQGDIYHNTGLPTRTIVGIYGTLGMNVGVERVTGYNGVREGVVKIKG